MKICIPHRSRRGAAFVTTLVFTALLLAMAGAILSWSTAESRLNRAHSYRLEARNATEALLGYGAAVAAKQVQESTEYSASFCDPSAANKTLALPAATAAELFDGTNIDPNNIEVVGKVVQINRTGGYEVKATDPRNNYSTLRGLRGKDGRLTLLARASTLPDARGQRQSIYMEKTYTVLDAPVLQYAAFYNMDLEVAPGPQFNIYGPVHTNANIWVSKQSAASSSVNLSFWEAVTAWGYIRKGFKVQPIQSGGTRETTQEGHIRFMTPAGSFGNLYGSWSPFSNVWRDQFMGGTVDRTSDFLAFTNATFGDSTTQSYLQTSAHGVQRRPLPGQLDNYVEDPDPTDGIIAPSYRNVPRALIERPLYSGDVEWIGQEVEMQKMSRKAGLYIIVNAQSFPLTSVRAPDGTTITGGLQPGEYRAYARNLSSSTMAPTYTEVRLPGQPTVGTHTGHPWLVAHAANPDVRPLILVRPNQMTDMRRFTNHNPWLARSAGNRYDPKRLNLVEVDMTVLRLAVDYTVNGNNRSYIFPYDANMGGSSPTPVVSNTDPRYRSTYRADIDEYGVNTGALVNRREGLYTHSDNRYSFDGMLATQWDGSMYIEVVDADFFDTAYLSSDATAPVPVEASGATTSWRRRIPGYRNSGVRLINGRGPIASANAARVGNTAAPCSWGLTFTTNDALYIYGHLNADGRVQTTTVAPTQAQLRSILVTDESSSGNNSSLFRDPQIINGAPVEQPLALVADAITILSQPVFNASGYQTAGWCDALSDLTMNTSNWNANWATTALSGSNQRDGVYQSPGSNKFVLSNAATRSPLEAGISSDRLTVATGNASPAANTKFFASVTEISAGFIIGLSPSQNNPADVNFASSTNDGNNSGGLHNLPRFLEDWNNTNCAIRGSMVVMFESKVAWEPFNLRVYTPPGRQWGFHNYFRNFYFSDDIPATRNVGVTNEDTFHLISRADYIAKRDALWSSYSFSTPP